MELNVTERLLISTLGVKTLLFRPPYGIDHQPETADEVAQLPIAQSMGYIIVGARIDPHDWGEPGGVAPASADVIVQRVLEQARSDGGNIVLLHDGGGDRSHTVAALPQIIDGLRAAGFQIVPVSELLGQTRAQLMPSLSFRERLVAQADGLIFTMYEWSRLSVAFIFVLGIALVSCRALVIGLLAVIEKFRAAPPDHPDFQPLVSVLIPAYNEEEVIVYTVNSVLESDYPNLEVIVVDDGSTDGTGDMLDSRIRTQSRRARDSPAQSRQARGPFACPGRSFERHHRNHRRGHFRRAQRRHQTRPPLRQSPGRRRCGKRKSREPRQLAHALAGARIRDQSEP